MPIIDIKLIEWLREGLWIRREDWWLPPQM